MIQRFIKSERGTSVIEFAIIAPVLIFMLLGLIDVGRGMYFGIVAQNAARAAAAYGSQSPTLAEDGQGMTTAANNDGDGISWSVNAIPQCSVSGAPLASCPTGSVPTSGTVEYVNVHVTGSFRTLVQYPGLPASIPITGTSVVRVVAQ